MREYKQRGFRYRVTVEEREFLLELLRKFRTFAENKIKNADDLIVKELLRQEIKMTKELILKMSKDTKDHWREYGK